MSYIDIEVESNICQPFNSRYTVSTQDTVGSLLKKIDFESLGPQLDEYEAVLKFHGQELPKDSTFGQNNIKQNDILFLTIYDSNPYEF